MPMRLQKAALSSTVSTMKCPASDFIPELTMHYREVWQAEWDGCSAYKLHSVKPHLGYCSVTHLPRRDAVILRRLRIGHTRVTHQNHRFRKLGTGSSIGPTSVDPLSTHYRIVEQYIVLPRKLCYRKDDRAMRAI